jgi:hypothetical protein
LPARSEPAPAAGDSARAAHAGPAGDTAASEASPAIPAAAPVPEEIPAKTASPENPAASVPEPSLADRIAGWERNELGVTVQGKASSRFLQSALGGRSARISQPTHENLAYSRADVEFLARPSAATAGRLEFRLHQDWENYYDEGPNPLLARWFDFTGTLWDGRVKFGLGDFHGLYSPLTLYSPGLDIPYEPEIFAARRQMAMDEWHLADHGLPLQGLNVAYADGWPGGFGLQAGAIASRLRTGGASQSTWLFWTDDVEKLMGAGYVKARLFGGLEIGATRVQIVDPVPTSRSLNNEYVQVTPAALYEDVAVTAGNLAFDAKRFLEGGPFSLKLGAEFARSDYMPAHDVADTLGLRLERRLKQDGSPDSVQVPILGLRLVKDKELKDDALRAALHAGYRDAGPGPFGLALDLAFLKNGKDYVNDVAQSPVFLGRRILNSANQVGGFGGYNTFDALYDNVYTVDPVTNVNTSEFWFQDTKAYNGTNNWYRAPQFKNSYGNTVMTKTERDQAAAFMDPQVQLLYPFGPATPNRQGVDASLSARAWDGKLEASALFASLEEPDPASPDAATMGPAQSFGRLGGGLKAQVGRLLGLGRRITVSAGYVADRARKPAYSFQDTAYAAAEVESALSSAGLYASVWKGLALSAGYQRIRSNPYRGYTVAATTNTKTPDQADLTQGNWAVGLEYRIAAGVYVTAEYGAMSLEEAESGTGFSQDLASAGLLVGF